MTARTVWKASSSAPGPGPMLVMKFGTERAYAGGVVGPMTPLSSWMMSPQLCQAENVGWSLTCATAMCTTAMLLSCCAGGSVGQYIWYENDSSPAQLACGV